MVAVKAMPTSDNPSSPKPNYVNPVTHGPGLLIVNTISLFLVTICVAIRLYTRIAIKRWFGADDWLIVVAYIFTVGTNIVAIIANQVFYWNRHVWDIPPGQTGNGKIVFVASLMFVLSSFFIRVSLICFYYRLVNQAKKPIFRWSLHLSLAYVVAIAVAFGLVTIFQCIPISAIWTPGAKGRCIDARSFGIAAGIFHSVADVLVTVIPIPMVMGLKLPRRQRVGAILLFSLGFISTAAGIVRTHYTIRAFQSYDQTWKGYGGWISTTVEIDLGLMVACAPAIRTLFSEYFPNFGSKASALTKSIFLPRHSETYRKEEDNSSLGVDNNLYHGNELTSWRSVHSKPHIKGEGQVRISSISKSMSASVSHAASEPGNQVKSASGERGLVSWGTSRHVSASPVSDDRVPLKVSIFAAN